MNSKYKYLIKKENELELFKILYLEEREKVLDLTILVNDLRFRLSQYNKK